MMFINLGIILIFVGIIGLFISLIWDIDVSTTVSCTSICLGLIITLCWIIDRNTNPTAMDVYQGKTTLEITYRDSVPVDSIVVFKNKEK